MNNQCCICDKEITGIETFGPIHFPVCYRCFSRFTVELAEVEQSTKTTTQMKKIQEMRGESRIPEIEAKTIKALSEQAMKMQWDIDDLEDELWGKRRELEDIEKKIASIKRSYANETN